MDKILKYIEDEIQSHIDNEYETDYDTAWYAEDTETALNKMYDVGCYETLLQIKKYLEDNK